MSIAFAARIAFKRLETIDVKEVELKRILPTVDYLRR